jgi:hypothetical protein
MINKMRVALISVVSLLTFATPIAVSSVAYAAAPTPVNNLCYGVNNLQITPNNDGNCADPGGEDKVNTLIQQVINVLSAIVGIVAVIMIIVGGFRYITSGGSPDKVTSAKNTILYGIIGLIVVALAQIIVKFVIAKVVPST